MKNLFLSLKPFFVSLLLALCASGLSFVVSGFSTVTIAIFVSGCFMGIALSAADNFERKENVTYSVGTILLVVTIALIISHASGFYFFTEEIVRLTIGVWIGYLLGYLSKVVS